jgi:hypothetical protein
MQIPKLSEQEIRKLQSKISKNKALVRKVVARLAIDAYSKYELRGIFACYATNILDNALQELIYKKMVELKDDGRYYLRTEN